MQRLSAAAGIPQSGEMVKILVSSQLITDYNSKHATGFVSFDQVPYYNPAIASGHLETLTVASHHLQQLTKSAMKKCISNKNFCSQWLSQLPMLIPPECSDGDTHRPLNIPSCRQIKSRGSN